MADEIVVVGSLNMDLVACASRIPVAGETLTGHRYFDEPGGKGANQAYAAAKLGGRVAMIGRVGDDDFGRRMRANLEHVGCDVSGTAAVANCASGIALIFVGDSGQNSIVIVPGANHRLTPADVEAASDRLRHAAVVLLQLENPLPTVAAAARITRGGKGRVVLDPAPAPASAATLAQEILRHVDILTPNETEAAILAGFLPGGLNPEAAIAIGRELRALGPRAVIVKLGEQGCVLVTEHEALHLSAPSVTAVDTTAAGDVFNAALGVALAEGLSLEDACRFANVAAAASVTRLGTQAAAPSRQEVEGLRA
ncbi:MAG TPA: ribokinase [Terriglobia bacterium]|nr:ribokinase [Terriglobia bacterium]